MADISAKDVAALRKITGAGMMDCKKALTETDGDVEQAKDWLREKGIAGAAKQAGREANEGAIEVRVEGGVGALVELNCTTDFVAKGDVFKQALAKLVQIVIEKGDADLGAQQIDGESVDDFVKGLAGSLGENIQLGRIVRFETADGLLDAYKHIQNERGVVGVLVELGGVDPSNANAREVAHDIALHMPPAPRPAGPLVRTCRPTWSSASARSTRASPARRASPKRRGPRSSTARSTGSTRPIRAARSSSSRS